MRKTKILIKSFDELFEIFGEEETIKTFKQISSLFTEDETKYWIGSGVEMQAEIVEENDIYPCKGFAILEEEAVENHIIALHPDTFTEIQN